ESTNEWLAEQTPGRGLGLVLGSLDQRPGNDIYVANDMTSNHYWSAINPKGRYTNDASSTAFQLTDQSAVRGLAVNRRSLSQASMGIAAGDADGDGDLDMFLTHFTNDHNTFYEQIRGSTFTDSSDVSNLAADSVNLLGWGTQFVDGNNDGRLELFIANGHVDDFTHDDLSFRMPPQLYRRGQSGRWNMQVSESTGDYFEKNWLARATARLDANADGRVDMVVTHLFDPVALLINETQATTTNNGNCITVRVVGDTANRDAIGAVLTLQRGQDEQASSQTRYVLAGNGYHCRNAPQLHFGLGQASETTQPMRLSVQWPDGETSQHAIRPDASGEWLIVQGQESLTKIMANTITNNVANGHSNASQN
ncbi:MAG: ASPIC/UnbV domain-containing protein, partial [Planctomycetota bacterium]